MGQTDESNNTTPKSQEREYSDWKRIRSVVEHENTLINYRQTWLLTSQAFLLTAFGTLLVASGRDKSCKTPNEISNEISFVLSIIPFFGIFIGIILQRALNAAEDYLKELDQWWYFKLSILEGSHQNTVDVNDWKHHTWHNKKERKRLIIDNIKEHPPLQGWTGDESNRLLHYPVTPSLFILLWICIFWFAIFMPIPKVEEHSYKYIEASVLVIVITIYGIKKFLSSRIKKALIDGLNF
jgi:hypothetical protein